MTTYLATTPALIVSALASAVAGDVIQLAPGDYGAVLIKGVQKPDPGVTIDATAASFTYLEAVNCAGITIKGGAYRPNDWHGAIYVIGSQRISLVGPEICGADNPLVGGITFRDSSDVALDRGRISHVGIGLAILNVQRANVMASSFFAIAVDGIDLKACDSVTIEANGFSGFKLVGDQHPDAIQVQTPPLSGMAVTNLTVRRNVILGDTQGFGAYSGGLVGALIEENAICVSYPAGINLNTTSGVTLKNNRVSTCPGAQWPAKINVVNSPDLVRTGNIVDAYTNAAGQTWPALADAA